MERPCRDGADRAERHEWRLTSSFSSSRPSSSPSCHPPPDPRASGGRSVRTLGEAPKGVKDKIPDRGVVTPCSPHILGPGRLGLLVCGRRLAMLAALHVLPVERDALLAERAGLGGVRGEIAAHQAEDLLAVDHRLLGAPPQGADPD